MAIEISLCMIVKNEEGNLGRCLDSVAGIADEIIIVDTGSTDKTAEIASHYTDKIFHFEWQDDFAAARNDSFSKATKEYVMWLDADDFITEENRQKILIAKEFFPKDVDYVIMDYYTLVDDKGEPILKSRRERIMRRSCGFKWTQPIHEYLQIYGKGYISKIFITHGRQEYISSNERNFSILKKRIEDGISDERDLYYYSQMLYSRGDTEKALDYTKKFLSLNKGVFVDGEKIYFMAYHLFMENGEQETALSILLDNEFRLKDKSEYYCHLGNFYSSVNQDDKKAIEYFKKAIDCQNSDQMSGVDINTSQEYYYFIPYSQLGKCQIKNKQYRDAYDSFRKALSYKPDDENTQQMIDKLALVV